MSNAFRIVVNWLLCDSVWFCLPLSLPPSLYVCVLFFGHITLTETNDHNHPRYTICVTSEFLADLLRIYIRALHVTIDTHTHKSESGYPYDGRRMLNVNWYVYFGLCSDYRWQWHFSLMHFFGPGHLDIWHVCYKSIVFVCLTLQYEQKINDALKFTRVTITKRKGHEKSTSITKLKWVFTRLTLISLEVCVGRLNEHWQLYEIQSVIWTVHFCAFQYNGGIYRYIINIWSGKLQIFLLSSFTLKYNVEKYMDKAR